MHPIIGVALSLLLSEPHNGSNGFDPTSVSLLREAEQFLISDRGSKEFLSWLEKDTRRREPVVRYFVACAFEEDVVVNLGSPPKYVWKGALGLAPSLKAILASLDSNKRNVARLIPTHDDGRWVSTCLMALANVEGSHQYVLLRGNPPTWSRGPTAAELWTMGYPEGVFFADLLNFNVTERSGTPQPKPHPVPPTRADLEKSYTLSLNLPEGYSNQPPFKWAPPNASNGRTLDFALKTVGHLPTGGTYAVARRLGTFGTFVGNQEVFQRAEKRTDPDYAPDGVCIKAGAPGPRVVKCSSVGAERFRPLFVHSPRVVNLSAAGHAVDPSMTIQTLDTGSLVLSESVLQKPSCRAGVECTGPVRLFTAGEPPVAPEPTLPSRTLAKLSMGQSVTVTLLYDQAQEKRDGRLDEKDSYTAIVRYRSPEDAVAQVEVSTPGKGWRSPTRLWPKTGREWQWLQVYPVGVQPDRPGTGRPSLKIRITGLDDGASSPTLDVAGFVPGPPWCLEDPSLEFAGVCLDKVRGVSLLRRSPPPK